MNPWILSFRPKTLTAAIVPVMVGSAVAYAETSALDGRLAWLTLLAALFIQIATNLFNDALDFRKGTDREDRLGPARATQQGWLSEQAVLRMGVLFLGFAVICGVPLVLQGGQVILGIGLVSMVLAYAYTGGPYPLAYYGLGDLFVLLFFGLIAVGGTYFLQTLSFNLSAVVAGVQVGGLATVLIAVNNLRDVRSDELSSKRTLAVLLGKNFVRFEILALYILVFGLGAYWWSTGERWAAIFPLVCMPLTFRVVKAIFVNEPGEIFNRILALSALVQILFGLLLTLGLTTSWTQP